MGDKAAIVPPDALLNRGATGITATIVKPTGFHKVVLRPAREAEPDRAIAFLVPHTAKEMPMPTHFRQFVARIDLGESASGFAFFVPDAPKAGADQAGSLERKVPGN